MAEAGSAAAPSRASLITPDELQRLLSPPDSTVSERLAQQVVTSALHGPLSPARIASVLQPLLAAEQAKSSQLAAQLAESTRDTTALLHDTRGHFQSLLAKTTELRNNHESLEDALIDHTEVLVSSASQREQADSASDAGENTGSNDGTTLREKLEAFNQRRKELEVTKQWFAVLVKAEELGSVLAGHGAKRIFQQQPELTIKSPALHLFEPWTAVLSATLRNGI